MKQPKALRLAEWIEEDMTCHGDAEIAAELRRLHEVNQELLEALKAIKDHPNTRYEAEAQLSESTWNAIAKAEGEMK